MEHVDFAIQPSLATPDGTKAPDYVFYRNEASRVANAGMTLHEELLRPGAYAVGEAKRWKRPLDRTLSESSDSFDNKNPSYQISFYMQHSGMEWGILTNGKLWRLYHKDTAYKLDRYYEVDLPELLRTGDVNTFLYFYAFFRREAFDERPMGLRALLQASTNYAVDVSEALKKIQVYEALRHLAQGFLDYQRNGLGTDPATLRAIYDNSLILLYRVLFVLYAEARGLLPVQENEMYHDYYSLDAIKREVASERMLLPTSATLWTRLRELFHHINEGSIDMEVPPFNGGLFSSMRT